MELNNEQKAAVEYLGGSEIIIAGPGSGKTKTLTEKVRFLINNGFNPSEILLLTFSKRSQVELSERLKDIEDLKIMTFHSLGLDILKKNNSKIEIISATEKYLMLQRVKEEFGEFSGQNLKDIELYISKVKNESKENEITRFFDNLLEKQSLLDFDDLIINASRYLETYDDIKFKYVLVDEYQDTNAMQYKLIRNLLRDNKNICVVGDPNQSIYGFRGANKEAFDEFKKDFPDARKFFLEYNYRSDKRIVELSSKLFDEYKQISFSKDPGKITLVETFNEYSEADFIIKEINKIMGGISLNEADQNNDNLGFEFSDFAILYRKKSINRQIIKRLEESGIPYELLGEESPIFDERVNFIINILRFRSTNDASILENIMASRIISIDKKYIKKINKIDDSKNLTLKLKNAAEQKNLSNKIRKKIIELIFNLEEIYKITSFEEIINTIIKKYELEKDDSSSIKWIRSISSHYSKFDNPIETFLDEIDTKDQTSTSRVKLMTIHASKGLEFKCVFLVGLEKEVLPSSRNPDLDEEKRLLYVALSRAKNICFISKTQKRFNKQTQTSEFETLIKSSVEYLIDENIIKILKKIRINKEKKSQIKMF